MPLQGRRHQSKLAHILNPSTWKPNLDTRTFFMMLKGALPPTIVIAIYQSNAIADITLTIGYLSALISVLSQALMPRAKFMKIMLFDLLATCVSASLCCLAVFCAVKARQHNTPSDATEAIRTGYNSDACAVSGVWLIVMIWLANAIRAWRPMELQDPMVAFSIFASVTMTRAGMFVTLSEGLQFVSRLLKGFMIGFAIAIGVSLLIYPVTSRGHVFRDIRGYVTAIETVLKSQSGFVRGSSEAWTKDRGLLSRTRTALSSREIQDRPSEVETKKKGLQAAMAGLNALHGKLQSDLFYSKDEIAWGKLSAADLKQIGSLLRNLFLPLSGMAMLPDILDLIVKHEGERNNRDSLSSVGEGTSEADVEIHQVVETLHSRLDECSGLVTAGLQYALLKLELAKAKGLKLQPATGDEEKGYNICPTQPGFTSQFEQRLGEYYSRRKDLPRALASLEAFTPGRTSDVESEDQTVASNADVRQEFFLILYMAQLQDNILQATSDFVKFADRKVAEGTMQRSRIIFPIHNSIRQWLSITSESEEDRRNSSQSNDASAYQHQVQHPDPEHLPPANAWERGSTILRHISHVIRSEQSIFGFRVAAAAFCVAILAYLNQTQDFFIRQRCIWAMIVIVIGMSPTSGQTMLGFVTRIAATVVSLALSLMVWYIPDQKTAGVIVFLYLANVFEYYFYIAKPALFGPSIIAIVTLNVIVGYELQIRKLGHDVGTSNGQPYYPIYLFGPYKLATVAAGCAISFFWVILPYPITSKTTLRKTLGRGLFGLANFYSCMHTTIELWLSGELGNIQDTHSSSYKLSKTRRKIFREEMTLLNTLRGLSHFSTFEPRIGGKFPKDIYDNIIAEIHRMLISMALMAQTSQNLQTLTLQSQSHQPRSQAQAQSMEDKWISRLASIALHSSDFKSHSTTSLLCHLSSSITNAQPLPPYLSSGNTFPLARQLQQIDGELLSIRHVEDPAFSAFVSLEVLRSVVSFGLGRLLEDVKSLVGELSFEFDGQSRDMESRALMADEG
ncbi:hypothetical protein BJX99DRAFT_260576 [Aspergillus californicus]